MLRLKQIDINGFKSFCDRERLRFPGTGIAAVVGPNGCGKSNICDAVNWVLGEQSAKSLRGSRMHDVIFNGSRNRAPAGLATVTLTLYDSGPELGQPVNGSSVPGHASLPASLDPGEIAVTRKLFSSGQSKYMLNGKVVRLRDVQDLFLGSGLGPNHYAIIEQGRIGQLLSARPLDRRAFVEEAAGITRFKTKKRLADLKLANAELSLERVHDILQEVLRQVRSLKRQADRADQYERYLVDLRNALSLLFAGRFRRSEQERKRLESELRAAKERLAAATAETERLESDLSRERDRERELDVQSGREREELSDLRIEEERMRERLSQQSRAVSENSVRIKRARLEIEATSSRILGLEADLLNQRQGIEELAAETELTASRLTEKESKCAELEAATSDKRSTQEACRNRLMRSLRDLSDSRARLGQHEETIAGLVRRLQVLRKRNEEVAERLKKARDRHDRKATQGEALRSRVAKKAAQFEDLRRAVAKRDGELEALRKRTQDCRAEVSKLTARRDSLREMLAHRAYTTETVKDVFEALERNPRPGFRPQGILADYLEVDEGYEKAVEQFLDEDLESVVVADWAVASQGVSLVRDEIGGRAAFLVRSHPGPASEETAPAIESAEPLASHVRFAAGTRNWGSCPLPKLREAFLVEDAGTAQRLAVSHPHLCFLLRDGTWYRGNLVHAGRKSSGGPLILKQQLRDLAPRIADAKEALEAAEQQTEASVQSARRESESLEALRTSLQVLERALYATEHDLQQAARHVDDLERTRVAACEEIGQTESELSNTESRLDGLRAKRGGLEAACQRDESLLADLEQESRDGLSDLAQLQEDRAALRAEVAALEERSLGRLEALRRAESLLADHCQRLDHMEHQVQEWNEENQELTGSNANLERRIKSGAARQCELRLRIDTASADLRESRARTTTLIDAVRVNRGLVERATGECSAAEIEAAKVELDLQHVAANCLSEVGEPIGKVAEGAPSELTDQALQEAEERHTSLKAKLERLGPVNVLARETFKQVSERRDFLEAQQQDLVDSIRGTRQAIREIDIASGEMFSAAFKGINRHFRQVFATLFGGGVGEMRLSDPDNVGESGIDIVAQPPGKRLQNVALLSGGEKSLTVMALLMATFRYKPSPFCILDEVDSQLDEANTVRMRRLLQEMAPETQFIVITHSKTTMEAAEALYGVTMGEAGVSKLVSVRMTDQGGASGVPGREGESTLAASA